MIKSICILGGGTAGLVTALLLRSSYPNLKIEVIESSKIGIIGVGEGSTEHWKIFMKAIQVSVPQLVRETGATFKIGIRFDNWNGKNETYFHSISEQFGVVDGYSGVPYTMMRLISEGKTALDTVWEKSINSIHPEPLDQIMAQYHFDTFKLNKFFHKLCGERNISVVDTDITDVILDDQGFVDHLIAEDGARYHADFFVDSSGFKKIISSKLGAKWIDCSEQLPMNSAIAFPTGYTEEIPSYTLSKAMNAGWRWRIPTQERYGNGYVFCDAFISETQAFDEVQSEFEEPLNIGKKVKFSAGYTDKFWIKNCLSVGLAAMFVEPLEASSIGSTIQQARAFMSYISTWDRTDTLLSNNYNQTFNEVASNIIDFIQLHYFTQREDTEFWRWCKHNIKMTDYNKDNLERWKTNFINPARFANNPYLMFTSGNFVQVMHGLGLFNVEKIKQLYTEHFAHLEHISKEIMDQGDRLETTQTFTPHRQALEKLKTRDTVWTYGS